MIIAEIDYCFHCAIYGRWRSESSTAEVITILLAINLKINELALDWRRKLRLYNNNIHIVLRISIFVENRNVSIGSLEEILIQSVLILTFLYGQAFCVWKSFYDLLFNEVLSCSYKYMLLGS